MLINAAHIDSWARNPEARHTLPELISRLILGSGVRLRRLDFPGGAATDLPGFDGLVEAAEPTPWVPTGRSVWELSCESRPGPKASDDLAKRTAQTSPEYRAETAFVFVTPRRWPGKARWVESARDRGWKEVRAYDADDLVQWLDATPAVALWFAERLGLVGPGVTSPEAFFERWRQACTPAITAAALAAGRMPPALELRRALARNDARPVTLRADSEAEAVAFAAALIARSKRLRGETVVVETPDGWRYVEQNRNLRIVLCASSALAEMAVQRQGLFVLVPSAAGDPVRNPTGSCASSDPILILPWPNPLVMERALIHLGLSEREAERAVRHCGRSWSVFRRLHAKHPAYWQSSRHRDPDPRALPLLALLNTFTDLEADREVVERIAGLPFEKIERELRALAAADDAPLLELGPTRGRERIFKAKSPLEPLYLAGELVTAGELERFLGETARVLSERDPALNLPVGQRLVAPIVGKGRRCSRELLDALAAALPRLAVRGPKTGLARLQITERIEALVRDLLWEADSVRWLSLSSWLPELAEAAPDLFLDAVDASLHAPDQPIAALFRESEKPNSGACCFPPLLRALERLAWSPERMPRVCELLCALVPFTRSDYPENAPARSLSKIFLPELPQTDAPLEMRSAVLASLAVKHPDIVFKVRVYMLPRRTTIPIRPSARPEWREEGLRDQRVSGTDYRRAVEAAAAAAIASARGHVQRLKVLIENLPRVEEAGCAEALLRELEAFAARVTSDCDREPLRAELRTQLKLIELHWDKPFPLRSWAYRLARLYHRLAPSDPVLRIAWLFREPYPRLPGSARTHEIKERVLSRQRIEAVRALQRASGLPAVLRLASSVEYPCRVGEAAVLAGIDPTELVDLAIAEPAARRLDDRILVLLGVVILKASGDSRKAALEKLLAHFHSTARPSAEIAAFLSWFTGDAALRELIQAQPEPVRPELRLCAPASALDIRALSAAGRPVEALRFLSDPDCPWEPELRLEVLEKLIETGPQREHSLLHHNIRSTISRLEKEPEIDRRRLARIEFAFFPLLTFGSNSAAAALFEVITSDPQEFLALVDACTAKDRQPQPPSERDKGFAERASEVLWTCSRVPGSRPDGTIDAAELTRFVEVVLDRAARIGRCEVREELIGQILAHAPADPDGAWPCRAVAALLDRHEFENVRKSFYIGVYNARGMVSKSIYEGGEQERKLAESYRAQAQRHAIHFPRLAATLRKVAKIYEEEALKAEERRRARL